MQKILRLSAILIALLLPWVSTIANAMVLNNPHDNNLEQNIRYGAFIGMPKTLDPARSYSNDESLFTAQIYEPPLQYHFLKRPFTLVPLTATQMPVVTYYDAQGQVLPFNTDPSQVAYSTYDIYIKPGIYYQPHPAFAKDAKGNYLYHRLTLQDVRNVHTLQDFPHTGTRELTADDYVYQIKRLAHPALSSPILGVMISHIVGLERYAKTLQHAFHQLSIKNKAPYLDLRQYPLEGVKAIDRYHYQIKIKGIYPQFQFWLAMPFFAPVPWEADYFYSQPGMADSNITMDWYPVGTGPYLLAENNPNRQMVLERNPNFRGEKYPSEGAPGDKENGYLNDAGKQMPFVHKFVFSLDKESIPRWNKFLQGYYDKSGISADSYDQAIKVDPSGKPHLTAELKKKGIELRTTVSPSLFYIGFNMLDDVVGGYSEQQRKLRQAISIAIDYEEYIAIFMNGRGIPAQSPIPPGIFGYQSGPNGIDNVIYFWDGKKAVRRPLEEAKKLLAEAGYPGGRNPKTGEALILNYDVASTGNPDDKSQLDWMRKQFAKLGIKLNIRNTQYNRFQDKVRRGDVQIFSFGWLADYPDPENFLFLLYGPNGKVKYGGENSANYSNPEFDKLFNQMKNMPNGPERQAIIDKMLQIIREDNPWFWGVHPIDFVLSHSWNRPSKPHGVANNILKYERFDVSARAKLISSWNEPITWPLWLLLGFVVILMIPLSITYWLRERKPTVRRSKK